MKAIWFAELFAAFAMSFCTICFSAPPTTAFTYQGQLSATAGGLVNNNDLAITFALYSAASGGSLVTVPTGINPVTTNGEVIDGLFTRTVDFGQIFNGATQYWIEVAVVDGSGTHILSPRQIVNTVPVAEYALKGGSISGIAAGGDLTGSYPNPTIGTGAVNLVKHAGVDVKLTLGGGSISAHSCVYGTPVNISGAQVGDQVLMTFTAADPPAGLIIYAVGVKTAGEVQVNNCNVTNSSLTLPNLGVRITTWR